jgi:hypothetical protein
VRQAEINIACAFSKAHFSGVFLREASEVCSNSRSVVLAGAPRKRGEKSINNQGQAHQLGYLSTDFNEFCG